MLRCHNDIDHYSLAGDLPGAVSSRSWLCRYWTGPSLWPCNCCYSGRGSQVRDCAHTSEPGSAVDLCQTVVRSGPKTSHRQPRQRAVAQCGQEDVDAGGMESHFVPWAGLILGRELHLGRRVAFRGGVHARELPTRRCRSSMLVVQFLNSNRIDYTYLPTVPCGELEILSVLPYLDRPLRAGLG